MARTERERKANDGVEAALLEYRNAYAEAHPEARVGALIDWIVVAAEILPGEMPEDDATAYSVIMPGGGISSYKAAGLLHCGIKYVMDSGTVEDE